MAWPYDDETNPADSTFGVNPNVQDIANDGTLDPSTSKLADQVAHLQHNIASVGLDPGEAEPRKNLFMQGLDALSYPLHGALGVLDAAVSGDIGDADVGTGWQRGEDQELTGSELLRKHELIDNPIARGAVGFGIDMLADPLTWLSFGTGTAAKIGGKALTEAGQALHATGVSRLAALGVTDAIDQSKMLEEAFRAIDIAQDAKKNLGAARSSAAATAAEAGRYADAEDVFSGLFHTEEALNPDLFKKATLNIGKDLPFLGHLTGTASPVTELATDAGPIGHALRAAGHLFSPDTLHVASVELPDNVLNAYSHVKDYANEALTNLGAVIAKTPIVGGALSALGEGAVHAATAVSHEFTKIFNSKALIGPGSARAREEFLNLKAAAPALATDRVVNMLGIDHLTNTDALKDAYLLIDSLGKDAVSKGPLDKEKTFTLLKKMSFGESASDGDLAELRNVFQTPIQDPRGMLTGLNPEQYFRSGLTKALADPNLRPEVKDIAQRVINGMDQLSLQEAEKGVNHGFLEYYVTHKYLDPERNPFTYASGSADAKFVKARSYDTIGDAFNQGGKIADTDIANLLKWRVQKSITLQGQVDFANRLSIENSLPQQLVTSLYKEAALDPQGVAAQVLKRNHFEPPVLNWDGIKDTAMSAERQKVFQGALAGDESAQKLTSQSLSEFSDYVHQKLWQNGVPPLDKNLPDGLLGEIGGKIKSPDGMEHFLPKAVADAYNESVASRDYFKELMGGSAIGRAIVKATDTSTNMMRKWFTMPWPAFWARHFTTGRFRQAMQGLEAMNPGTMARTYSLLNGEGAIGNKAGQLLDTPTFKRLLQQTGLPYSVADHIGTIQAHGDMDIDKFLRTGSGMLDNLFSSAKGSKGALLTQIHDKFEKGFDGFFRANHVIHRFEQGDSLGDAVKSANDTYFNYRGMSDVEKSWFRRFYMFYGFMSSATKATMTDLITAPGNIMLQLHGTRALAEFFSDPNAAPTASAHDYRLLNASSGGDRLSYHIGQDADGHAVTASGFGTPLEHVTSAFTAYAPRNFSVGELAMTAVDSAKRTMQKQFAASNPVMSAAAQALSGKNLYFDKPLSADFLRKLPDLTKAAEAVAGFAHTDIPTTINDAAKQFLDAVPDGKGRLIVNPAKMWILTNLIPGFARGSSMAGTFANSNIDTKAALMRSLVGINVADSDLSRSYLYDQKNSLEDYYASHDIKKRLDLLNDTGF